MSGETCPRLNRPPGQNFFLLGVRGVGKRTWARAQFPDAPHIDLLDETRYQDSLADPSLFAADFQLAPPDSWVVVNEIHRHMEGCGLNFALLGSSARKLKASGVNLLAGRVLHKTMHPLTPAELGGRLRPRCGPQHRNDPLSWALARRQTALNSESLRRAP